MHSIVSQLTLDFNPTKRCTKCGIEKSEDSFGMQQSRGRRRAECKDCKTIADKAWMAKRKANPPQVAQETKRCNQCYEVKPISRFSPGSPGYVHGKCRDCENANHYEKRREQYRNDPTGRYYLPFANEAGIMVKRCSHCYAEKPLTEYYPNGRRGRHGKCKDCDTAIKKSRYDTNPEKYRAAVRASMCRHPDRVKARHERWHTANHEKMLQHYREYHKLHREKELAYNRIRHIRDYEKERHYSRTHRAQAADNAHRRRARLMNAPRIEQVDRMALIERDNWTCYLCMQICTPKNVTLDHVVPLFRGGSHTADNLRVACLSCNCSKGTKHLAEFLK